jgi:hypothetical protein
MMSRISEQHHFYYIWNEQQEQLYLLYYQIQRLHLWIQVDEFLFYYFITNYQAYTYFLFLSIWCIKIGITRSIESLKSSLGRPLYEMTKITISNIYQCLLYRPVLCKVKRR